jgi:DNA-binding MarR family transcriptional regulator
MSGGVMSKRKQILEQLARVGRENSDATVLFHSHIAERMGLHPTDYKALGLLERLGPMSAGDLGKHSGLATASVTNLIDRLESKGYVRRIRDTDDRRRVLVEPVRDRLSAAGDLFGSARRSLARLFEAYADRDLAVIADFLGRNAERLREETRKLAQQDDADEGAGR